MHRLRCTKAASYGVEGNKKEGTVEGGEQEVPPSFIRLKKYPNYNEGRYGRGALDII